MALPKALQDIQTALGSGYKNPVGTVIWSASSTAPDGYVVCNGAAVSRTTYADLFAAIGTTYGTGDGSTTFNLPNLIDRFAQGSATVGTVKGAGLPNIWGNGPWLYSYDHVNSEQASGVFRWSTYGGGVDNNNPSTSTGSGILRFNANFGNPIYGNSETVQPPALTLLPCVKF